MTNDRHTRLLTSGVPDETRELWRRAIALGKTDVFSSRPDTVMTTSGPRIIEYNVDGGADKGNTQGVVEYTQRVYPADRIGHGLARLAVEAIASRTINPRSGMIEVATLLPVDYRSEYAAQNIYFAREAHRIAEEQGLPLHWRTYELSQVRRTDSGSLEARDGDSDPYQHIDVVDREFKLPGFDPHADYRQEKLVVDTWLDGDVDLLGSILPYSDKTLFGIVYEGGSSDPYHTPTAVMDSDSITISEDTYTLEDVQRAHRLSQHFVLKRGGDTLGTTGSKGVYISQDMAPGAWSQIVEDTHRATITGQETWVIQPLLPSKPYAIDHIANSRSVPRHTSAAVTRVAPYYIRDIDGYRLGDILVTAGTDPETQRKRQSNIHGLRGNTYLATEVSDSQKDPDQ